MAQNGINELRKFFSVDTKGICTDSPSNGECTLAEFRQFWTGLTDTEKEYYKNAEIG